MSGYEVAIVFCVVAVIVGGMIGFYAVLSGQNPSQASQDPMGYVNVTADNLTASNDVSLHLYCHVVGGTVIGPVVITGDDGVPVEGVPIVPAPQDGHYFVNKDGAFDCKYDFSADSKHLSSGKCYGITVTWQSGDPGIISDWGKVNVEACK